MKRDAPFDALTLRGPFDDLFGGVWLGRRVLVTGHTGFKGSWLALWLQALGADVCGLALPPEEGPNHLRLLGLTMDEALVDLRNAAAVRAALGCYRPEVVFHLAAQPLVRRSYREPAATFDVNVMGLVNLLEAVRATPSVKVVVNATSDKCYLNRESSSSYREDDALGGHDPYSASKACAEIVSASWRSSFLAGGDGDRVVALATARAGNVIGGGDWSEDRLVPDLVRSAASGEPTSIRRPQSTRPWQHVLEPLAGYLTLGQRLLADPRSAAEAWNFGPDASGHLSVAQVIVAFARAWPAVRCNVDRSAQPHEAGQLHLDSGKARERLGWRPVWSAAQAIERTGCWYRRQHEEGAQQSHDDLARYVADARDAGLAWAPCRVAEARMKFESTPIEGVWTVDTSPRVDERGSLTRVFCAEAFARVAPALRFVQVNHSITTRRGTVRGLHFQRAPSAEWKLIRCLRGRVFDVAVDLREGSATFGRWHAVELSEDNQRQILIPPGCAHGFQARAERCDLLYQHSEAYAPEREDGVRHDDPRLAIAWPEPVTAMSPRDRGFRLIDAGFEAVPA